MKKKLNQLGLTQNWDNPIERKAKRKRSKINSQ